MKVVFFGTPEFAVESLDAIVQSRHEVVCVVTVPDRPSGRGQKVLYSAVKQYALDRSLPLLQPEKLRDEDFLQSLASYGADCFVVVAFRMLPEVVWAMPPCGTFNLHASLLPQLRGAAPINWAIIRGYKESGISTFMLNPKIDEGAILMQEATPLSPTETAGTLHDRLAEMGRGLVVRTLDAIAEKSICPMPQQGEATTAPKIFKEDCRIDFSRTAEEAERLVRGLCPYPAATLSLRSPDGEEVGFKIFAAEAEREEHRMEVGKVLCDGKKYLKIATTDGFLNILELQMAGKKRITIGEFLRGNNVKDWETVIKRKG